MICGSVGSKSRLARAAGEEPRVEGRHEKLHAAVAHLQLKMLKELTVLGHFLKLGCGKLARHCGAKHICKSKCTKHTSFGALFEVQLPKNGTPL